jgi:Na+/melibiose symporter-like transporter
MPVACDKNGFQIANYCMDEGEAFYGLLMYLLVISALIGVIIGVLLLKKKDVKPHIDWAVIIVCIASGIIVYFKFLDDLELQSGAYFILVGWIIALLLQIISKIKKEV